MNYLNDVNILKEFNKLPISEVIHPNLFNHIDEMNSILYDLFHEGNGFHKSNITHWLEERRNNFLKVIKAEEYFGVNSVIRVPVLSEKACDIMTKHLDGVDFPFASYEDEGTQLGEYKLMKYSPLYAQYTQYIYRSIVIPLWAITHGLMPHNITSMQFSKYGFGDGEKKDINWHFDGESNCSTVIELTQRYEEDNEKFEIYPNMSIPATTKKGYATFFNGFNAPHRFTGISQNERYILVYLCNDSEMYS